MLLSKGSGNNCRGLKSRIASQGLINFPKIQAPPENFRRQRFDMKQVPYWGPTNIIRHPTESRRPRFVHPCHFGIFCREGNEEVTNYPSQRVPVAGPGIGHGTFQPLSSPPRR